MSRHVAVVVCLAALKSAHAGRKRAAMFEPRDSAQVRHRQWFDARVGDQLEDGVRRLTTGIAESFGAKADVVFSGNYPATVNDPALARRAAEAVSGEARVRHMAKTEDRRRGFLVHAERQAGQLHHAGRRPRDRRSDAASPAVRFNDEVLPVGLHTG